MCVQERERERERKKERKRDRERERESIVAIPFFWHPESLARHTSAVLIGNIIHGIKKFYYWRDAEGSLAYGYSIKYLIKLMECKSGKNSVEFT